MQIAVCFSFGSVLVEGHLDLRVLILLVFFHKKPVEDSTSFSFCFLVVDKTDLLDDQISLLYNFFIFLVHTSVYTIKLQS